MAYEIGFVDNSGSEGVAHWQMLLKLKTFAEAHGWTTLRYTNPTPYTDATVTRELILKGVGLSGTEEIFIGFRAYQNQSADYYNLTVAGFTGYVDGNAFTAQPGYIERGVCAHNQRIDYWLNINAQRVLMALKIGAPAVYEVAYVGKFFPYATPGQYPYPIACIGTLNAANPAIRYDNTTTAHGTGARGGSAPGTNGYLRNVSGSWVNFSCLPWSADFMNAPTIRRDTGGYYSAIPATVFTGDASTPNGTGNVWGDLDGLRYLSGFNNVSENTCTIDGKLNVLFGDAWRTGIGDYFLLEMS